MTSTITYINEKQIVTTDYDDSRDLIITPDGDELEFIDYDDYSDTLYNDWISYMRNKKLKEIGIS
jgi:hypothetical protein